MFAMDSFYDDDKNSDNFANSKLENVGQCPIPQYGASENVQTKNGLPSHSQTNGDDSLYYDDNGYSDDDKFNSDLDESEIDEMLEKGLLEHGGKRQKMYDEDKSENKDYSSRKKIVLVEKNPNHFEVLPDGWIMVKLN